MTNRVDMILFWAQSLNLPLEKEYVNFKQIKSSTVTFILIHTFMHFLLELPKPLKYNQTFWRNKKKIV